SMENYIEGMTRLKLPTSVSFPPISFRLNNKPGYLFFTLKRTHASYEGISINRYCVSLTLQSL
ncbi:MAG: hypothetical protein R6U89_01125, partial [Dehalococcoidia bacterium]